MMPGSFSLPVFSTIEFLAFILVSICYVKSISKDSQLH